MSKLFWGAAASMVAGAVLAFVTASYAMHQPTEFLRATGQMVAHVSGFSLATQVAQAVAPTKAAAPVVETAPTIAEATPAPEAEASHFGGLGVFHQAREMIREEQNWKDSEKQLLAEEGPHLIVWNAPEAGEDTAPAPINVEATEPAAECPNKACCKDKKCCGDKGCAADKSCCEKAGCCKDCSEECSKDNQFCPEHIDCCPMLSMVEAVLQVASNAMTHALMVPVMPVAQETKDSEGGVEESEPMKDKDGQAPDCNEDANYEHRYPGCPYLGGDPKCHTDRPVTVPQTGMLPKTKTDENVGGVEEAEIPSEPKPALDTMEFRREADAKKGEFDKKPM
jgi:hypothetical protein